MQYMCHESSRENEAHPQEGEMKEVERQAGKKVLEGGGTNKAWLIQVNFSIIERWDVTIGQTLGDVIEVTISFLYITR